MDSVKEKKKKKRKKREGDLGFIHSKYDANKRKGKK